jgi:hypothetical protein
MNIAIESRNIMYIPWLTDEITEKHNAYEYNSLYSSVTRNIGIYSLVT